MFKKSLLWLLIPVFLLATAGVTVNRQNQLQICKKQYLEAVSEITYKSPFSRPSRISVKPPPELPVLTIKPSAFFNVDARPSLRYVAVYIH